MPHKHQQYQNVLNLCDDTDLSNQETTTHWYSPHTGDVTPNALFSTDGGDVIYIVGLSSTVTLRKRRTDGNRPPSWTGSRATGCGIHMAVRAPGERVRAIATVMQRTGQQVHIRNVYPQIQHKSNTVSHQIRSGSTFRFSGTESKEARARRRRRGWETRVHTHTHACTVTREKYTHTDTLKHWQNSGSLPCFLWKVPASLTVLHLLRSWLTTCHRLRDLNASVTACFWPKKKKGCRRQELQRSP